MKEDANRTGRPRKAIGRREKRARLTLVVSADAKRRIAGSADLKGVSLNAETEALIEKALLLDVVLAGMSSSEDKFIRQGFEAAARKLGYRPHRGKYGTEWLPPGDPRGSSSEWGDSDKKEGQQ